jgi:hypothetical protein
VAAFWGVLGAVGSATAQTLPDNSFAIDVFQGPILAPIRVTGIAAPTRVRPRASRGW